MNTTMPPKFQKGGSNAKKFSIKYDIIELN